MLTFRSFKPSFKTLTHSCVTLRNVSGRIKCLNILDVVPRCSPINSELIKCQKELKKQKEKYFQFTHLFSHADCCGDPCIDMFPRFDDLYYMPTDKANRRYTRTWNECKSPLCKKKLLCRVKKPTITKRRRRGGKKIKGLACEVRKDSILSKILLKCRQAPLEGKCPTFALPFCKKPRNPPKCVILRGPANCCRICAPYPAYSECDRPALRKGPPKECNCLERVSLCDLYDLKRKGLVQEKEHYRTRI